MTTATHSYFQILSPLELKPVVVPEAPKPVTPAAVANAPAAEPAAPVTAAHTPAAPVQQRALIPADVHEAAPPAHRAPYKIPPNMPLNIGIAVLGVAVTGLGLSWLSTALSATSIAGDQHALKLLVEGSIAVLAGPAFATVGITRKL